MTLITGNAPGNDMRFYMERVEANRNFANKIWNASRFIMMNLPEEADSDMPEPGVLTDDLKAALQPEDRWILSKFNSLVGEATDNMERFELGIAVQKVYDFIWGEFCDWYIEMVKPRLYKTEDRASQNAALWTLQTVLIGSLKLLHPYMPFITEEIYCTLKNDPDGEKESIMISDWPVRRDDFSFPAEEEAVEIIKETVSGIRTVRAQRNIAPSRKARVYVVSQSDAVLNALRDDMLFFENLASASDVVLMKEADGIDESALSVVLPFATAYLPLADVIDIDAERARLKKEEQRLEGELKRSRGMLSNEKFLAKAPEAKVAEEKEKLARYEQQLAGVQKELEKLG